MEYSRCKYKSKFHTVWINVIVMLISSQISPISRTPMTAGLKDLAQRGFDQANKEITEQYSDDFLKSINKYVDYILEAG